MKVSVIIATRCRKKQLLMVIQSLKKQTENNFELIIINDSMEDLKIEKNIIPDSLKVTIVQNNQNFGVSYSRNLGAKIATGDLLLFLDDDRVLPKDAIKCHIKAHKENFKTIVVGNRWELFNFITEKQYNRLLYMLENDLSVLKRREESLSKIFQSIFKYNSEHPSLFLLSLMGNTSIKKKHFETLNGFDEKMERMEDIEFGYRFYRIGGIIIYNDSLDSFHLPHERKNYYDITKRSLDYLYHKYEKTELDLSNLLNGEITVNEYFFINKLPLIPDYLNQKIIYFK